jgi:lipopolysaccharide transport system permease protein
MTLTSTQPRILGFFVPALELLAMVAQHSRVLKSTTLLELRQKYAGSVLGSFWIILYPLLFLSIYMFLYLVIFRLRFPGYSQLNFVTYVFSGLLPYLILMDALGRGAIIIRENMHLLRNVILPPELVVVRVVLAAITAQIVSFLVLFVLIAADSDFSWRIVFLPIFLAFAALFVLGLTLLLASLGAVFSDISHLVGLILIFLLFVSPIAFKSEMVPERLRLVVDLNPISYLVEGFRWSLLRSYQADTYRLLLFPIIATLLFAWGARFFDRFKGLMVEDV